VIDKIKLQILYDHIEMLLLNWHQQDAAFFASVAGDAGYIARELSPVAAKALQWLGSRSGDYRVFEIEPSAHEPQILNMCGHVPRYDPIGKWCKTQHEARAACEQHHQQTFKDQIA
jgi:hypothetical protein